MIFKITIRERFIRDRYFLSRSCKIFRIMCLFHKLYIMKIFLFLYLATAMSLLSLPAFSQTKDQPKEDTTTLGLPGDNLDLYAVLTLFQKSKTIEAFEK